MTTVVVQQPGASLSARGGRLVIESKAGKQEVPLGHVTELLVLGHARISTALIADLAGRNVPVHFAGNEWGDLHSVHAPPRGSIEALRVQFTAPEERRLAVARALVAAKIRNSRWVLRRMGVRAERLSSAGVDEALNADVLRGLEGYAARVYFRVLGELLPDWDFCGRMYFPPPDRVNAALSFAYTLLLGRTLAAVARVGLHPAVGTLHVSHGRRPALALDVMEPFRAPVCDLTVLTLLRSGQLPHDLFEVGLGEVRLGSEGCRILAHAMQKRLSAWAIDRALVLQVQAVQRGWAEDGPVGQGWRPPVRA